MDVEMGGAMVAVCWENGGVEVMGKGSREEIVEWIREYVERGVGVVCAQEACGFGYEFHRSLEGVGARSLVVAPEVLNGKRKTDSGDARTLCVKLWDYVVRGEIKKLKVVRVPTREQQRRRALWRQRDQLIKTRNMLAGHGRSYLQENAHYIVPERWWGSRTWPKVKARLEAEVVEMLERPRGLLVETEQAMKAIEAQIEQEQPGEAQVAEGGGLRPKGLGENTQRHLAAEMLDWNRFSNRKQVGSFIGCCPSEHSSGGSRRQGSIDRQGNAHVRCMLVEAVWRLRHWNPTWRGITKFAHILGPESHAGSAVRKKAVITCCRLLAIDLWRIETGQIAPEDVGFQTV
jgi:transposase